MSTESIVRHCAPTLAGMKVGSLFSQRFTSCQDLFQNLSERNKVLNSKGIYVVIVRIAGHQALIYMYRKSQLEQALNTPEIQRFLQSMGYDTFAIDPCLEVLQQHLTQEDFPHEIGVFLGYPLPDIQAFILHKGKNCPCNGCWKAYTNVELAQKTFQKFKKCTDVYCTKLEEGVDMIRLTVAV